MMRILASCSIALAISLISMHSGFAAAADYAMQMPGAARSLLLDVAAAGSRLTAVGERGHILVSDDDGANWTQVEVPTSAMLTRVFFVDEKLGWAVGHDGNILHSQDGGLTWVLQRDGLAHQVQINEQRAGRAATRLGELNTRLAVASAEAASELAEAVDEAQWQLDNAREALDSPAYAPPLMDVWFSTPEQGWAAGAYGTLLRTQNGGRDWQDWSHHIDNPEELHLNGVAGDALGALYLASEWGVVFVSRNAGERWEPTETGYDGSFFGILASPSAGSVFAYGLLGTIYLSPDQAASWQPLDSGVSSSLFGAAAVGETVIFVGQGGSATLTSDNGNTFTALVQPQRDGLFGVAPVGKGRFVATGEGGSRVLQDARDGGHGDE